METSADFVWTAEKKVNLSDWSEILAAGETRDWLENGVWNAGNWLRITFGILCSWIIYTDGWARWKSGFSAFDTPSTYTEIDLTFRCHRFVDIYVWFRKNEINAVNNQMERWAQINAKNSGDKGHAFSPWENQRTRRCLCAIPYKKTRLNRFKLIPFWAN